MGRSPVGRSRTGGKHHLITDATGIPLAITLTGGNRNDVTQLPTDCSRLCRPSAASSAGPGAAPDAALGDCGYDHDKYRRLVWTSA
jgi:transposase